MTLYINMNINMNQTNRQSEKLMDSTNRYKSIETLADTINNFRVFELDITSNSKQIYQSLTNRL